MDAEISWHETIWQGPNMVPEVLRNIGGKLLIPIPSMYGIFTYIYHKNQPNVGKYTIHGMGYDVLISSRCVVFYFKECFDAKCEAMGVLVSSCWLVWSLLCGQFFLLGCWKGCKNKAGTGIEMLIPRCFGVWLFQKLWWVPGYLSFLLGAHWIKMTTECLSFFICTAQYDLMKPTLVN